MRKKGASEVIATILLILIAVMIISIIVYFLWDYLKSQEENAGIMKQLSEENLGITDVTFKPASGADPEKIVLTLQKGPGSQEIAGTTPGIAAPTQGIVLVSDVSGSMEWCTDKSETDPRIAQWDSEGEYYCGERRYFLGECPEEDRKIAALKEATTDFVNTVTAYDNTKIGIVEYSSGSKVEKVDTSDLSVALYAGAAPGGCYPGDWQKKDFNPVGWADYNPPEVLYISNNLRKVYFRKSFSIDESILPKIKNLTLSLAHRDGVVCYINGKEVFYSRAISVATRPSPTTNWTNQTQVPIKVLEKDNVLACSVISRSGGWGFDAKLRAVKDVGDVVLVAGSQTWLIEQESNCIPTSPNIYDPKYVRHRRSWETNTSLLATIKNLGRPITSPFEVSFYNNTIDEDGFIGKVTINGLSSRNLTTASINFNATIPELERTYFVVVDSNDDIGEADETNNRDSRKVVTYPYAVGKDLTSDVYNDLYLCSAGLFHSNIRVRVSNIGTDTVTETFNVSLHYLSSGRTIDSTMMSGPIIAGGFKDVLLPISVNIPAGSSVSIYSAADVNNVVPETNEGNNNDTEAIDIKQPDMYIYQMDVANAICSLTPTVDVKATIRNRWCPASASKAAASVHPKTWNSPDGQIVDVEAMSVEQYLTKTFTIPLNITEIGQPYKFYAGVDVANNVLEGNENNNLSNISYSGVNLKITEFEAVPGIADSGESTTFDITAKFINSRNCPSGDFNVTFYKDAIGGEKICEQTFNLAGKGSDIMTCAWTTALDADTTIFAFVDSENVVPESSENDNDFSSVITVEGGMSSLVPFSILPLPLNIGTIFHAIDWLMDDCDGYSYNLFKPDEDIPRTPQSLTNDPAALISYISKTETWWNTSICAGIKNATDMLLADSTLDKRYIVLMSDGNASANCTPGGDPKEDAKDFAAVAAAAGIDLYVIGFGLGEDIDKETLLNISQDANMLDDPDDRYYAASSASALAGVYEQIATAMTVTYKPVVLYDHIKVIVYAKGTSFNATIDYEDIPAPLEENKVEVPISPDWKVQGVTITKDDITKIELYAVALTEGGKEVISSEPIAVWEKPSEY